MTAEDTLPGDESGDCRDSVELREEEEWERKRTDQFTNGVVISEPKRRKGKKRF